VRARRHLIEYPMMQKAVDPDCGPSGESRMLSRALSLATVMLLIGWLTTERAQAQATNLEAGKSPSQIFAGTCNACHKSPRGLLKTVPVGSLPGFLRQHYTTSPEMANVLSSYLASNGAADTRYIGGQKGGKDGAKDGAKETRLDPRPAGPPDQLDRFGRRQRPAAASQDAARPDSKPEARPDSEPRQAAKPDTEEAAPQSAEPVRAGRNGRRLDAKRLARPASEDAEQPAANSQVPAHGTSERGPDGRRLSAKQKLSKRGRASGDAAAKDQSKDPFRELFRDKPKDDNARDEPSGTEPAKGETAKVDPGKSNSSPPDSSPPDLGKPDSSKPDLSKPDKPAESARPAAETPSQSAKAEPARDGETSARPDQAPPISQALPSVSASEPPAAPAGPPAPPMSQ
jgi:hypothetical protein